jgi:hypothetical protein
MNYYLSENDKQLFDMLVRKMRRELENTPIRTEQIEDELQSPHTHIVLSPVGGIAALEMGAGSSYGGSDTPGAAYCDVYRKLGNAATGHLQPTGMQILVHNVAETIIPANTIFVATRDRFGTWIASAALDAETNTTRIPLVAEVCSSKMPLVAIRDEYSGFITDVLLGDISLVDAPQDVVASITVSRRDVDTHNPSDVAPETDPSCISTCVDETCQDCNYLVAIFNCNGVTDDDFSLELDGVVIAASLLEAQVGDPLGYICRGHIIAPPGYTTVPNPAGCGCVFDGSGGISWQSHTATQLENVPTTPTMEFVLTSIADNSAGNFGYFIVYRCCGPKLCEVFRADYNMSPLGSNTYTVNNACGGAGS